MPKKPNIDEKAVDYIRKNKEALALKYPGFFLVFVGTEIQGKFKTHAKANHFARSRKLALYVIWHFDPLPDRVAEQVLYDQKKAKEERAKELRRQSRRRYYQKNKAKILKKQRERRRKNPEKNRDQVKAWYYKDHERTLRKKKAQRMGVIA